MIRERLRHEGTPKTELFLDSGVFSAWHRDTTIDIDAYLGFIDRNRDILEAYATVDVIPGKWGRKRTSDEVAASAKASYQNQQTIRGRGFNAIPVFHQGEHISWLERYLKDGEPYIGISTAKDMRQSEQMQWLDHVFTVLTDTRGVPFVKTHGFGVTTIRLLKRYPWYSADSTTWSLAPAYGMVYTPAMLPDGTPDFDPLPVRIITSGRTQKAASSRKRQYESLSPDDKQWADAWFSYVGSGMKELRYVSQERRYACARYFRGFAEHNKVQPFKHRQGSGWFEMLEALAIDCKPVKLWPHMRIYSATLMTNNQFSEALCRAEYKQRLISYWEAQHREHAFRKFVIDGIVDADFKIAAAKPGDKWNEKYMTQRRFQLVERLKLHHEQTEAD